MKILVLAHDASMYGASQSLLTALDGISKISEREILVLLPYKGKMEEALAAAGIDCQVASFPRCVKKGTVYTVLSNLKGVLRYYFSVYTALPKLKQILEQFDPDVIYTNTSVVSLGYNLSKVYGIPHVWHIREFGDTDYDFIYFPSKRRIAKAVAKSEKIIFGSKALQAAWFPAGIPVSNIVYNGILDETVMYTPKKWTGSLRLGLLGGILAGKGHDIAVQAFVAVVKRQPTARLHFYGNVIDKEFYDHLVRLISTLGLSDSVSFLGFIGEKDKIYDDLDVLINCSRNEGFGRSVAEAMARGVPVIANRSGGIPEIITDRVDGLLYDKTPESLSETISCLLNNPVLYESLSIKGMEKAKRFSVREYVLKVDEILRRAVRKKYHKLLDLT